MPIAPGTISVSRQGADAARIVFTQPTDPTFAQGHIYHYTVGGSESEIWAPTISGTYIHESLAAGVHYYYHFSEDSLGAYSRAGIPKTVEILEVVAPTPSQVPLTSSTPDFRTATWKGYRLNWVEDKYPAGERDMDFGLIESGIFQILNTIPGERVMVPDFGSRLRRFVFDPMDATLFYQIRSEIVDALGRWEPRIVVGDIMIVPDEDELSTVHVSIKYTLDSNVKDGREIVITFGGSV